MNLNRFEWEDFWKWFLCLLALFAVYIGALAIFAEHKVTFYYVEGPQGTGAPGVSCVKAHWTWESDTTVFCSDDPQKVIDFATKANQLVKK